MQFRALLEVKWANKWAVCAVVRVRVCVGLLVNMANRLIKQKVFNDTPLTGAALIMHSCLALRSFTQNPVRGSSSFLGVWCGGDQTMADS